MTDQRTRTTVLLLAVAIAGASAITLIFKHRPPAAPITVSGAPGTAVAQPQAASPVVTTGATDETTTSSDASPPVVPTSADFSQQSNAPQGPALSGAVTVDVGGAVDNPTVYSLPAGSRVIDAIRAAGGTTADADLTSVNQAAKLTDGEKVFIPSQSGAPNSQSADLGQPAANASGQDPDDGTGGDTGSQSGSSGDKLKDPADGAVNINTASLEELERLPDVGPAMAQRILDFRQQSGPFQSPDDLRNVKGIGPKKFAKMQPFFTVQ